MRFTIKDGSSSETVVSHQLTDNEFHQVVAVFDLDGSGSTDVLRLYVDGALVDTVSDQTAVADWSGSDNAGLGGRNVTVGGTGGAADDIDYGTFDGQIAIFRFYESKAFSTTQMAGTYQYVAGVALNFDAQDSSPSDTTWESTGSQSPLCQHE